jgi:thioredoxin-dependent peroxiredoxin
MPELKNGDKAPDFTLESSEGDKVTLSELRGKNVVLYFYPKDNTSGCTKEACGFRDLKSEFEEAGAIILGVSPDSLKSHNNFIDKFQLNFPLLSDPDRKVAALYDVYRMKKMYGRESMGIVRSTFIIDRQGNLAHVMYKVKVEGHMDKVLELVKAMN